MKKDIKLDDRNNSLEIKQFLELNNTLNNTLNLVREMLFLLQN